MKVGVFHPTLDLCGGAEVVAVVAANALAQSGYHTEILVNKMIDQRRIQEMVGEPLNPDIRIVINPNFLHPRGIFDVYESAVRSLAFKSKCDVLLDIYSNLIFPWTDVCYMHFPYINNYEFGRKFPYLKRPRLRQVSAIPFAVLEKDLEDYSDKLILTNSCFTANAVKESLGADSKVLYPPIPSTFYNRRPDDQERKRESLVITTARFGQGKGLELVPIIASLTDRSISFVMIGLAHDQNVINYVKKSIQILRLENRVKIITNASRQEIKTYLGKAKIYLHPTKMEHFGISIAEAMAMGCLPVVHDSGGAPEFVPDKYRYRTKEEAARIIENSVNVWTTKESNIMKSIAERFSESNFAKRFIELFSAHLESREE